MYLRIFWEFDVCAKRKRIIEEATDKYTDKWDWFLSYCVSALYFEDDSASQRALSDILLPALPVTVLGPLSVLSPAACFSSANECWPVGLFFPSTWESCFSSVDEVTAPTTVSSWLWSPPLTGWFWDMRWAPVEVDGTLESCTSAVIWKEKEQIWWSTLTSCNK